MCESALSYSNVYLEKEIKNLINQSLNSHHVSLVQWTTRLLPVSRDPGSKPLGD